MKKRDEFEGAKDYREINTQIRKDMKMAKDTCIEGQCREVGAYLRKNKSKKLYPYHIETGYIYNQKKTNQESASLRSLKYLTYGQNTAQTYSTMRLMGSNGTRLPTDTR